jgi:hypothetical protein
MFDLPERFSGDRIFLIMDGYAAIWEFSTITVFDPAQPRPLSLPIEFERRASQGSGGGRQLCADKISRGDFDRAFAQARRGP